MHYAEINAALHVAGTKPVELARELNVTRSMVSMVIHGNTTSKRIATRISQLIDVPVDDIWPGLYELEAA